MLCLSDTFYRSLLSGPTRLRILLSGCVQSVDLVLLRIGTDLNQAARIAGIQPVELITEPEAGALSLVGSIADRDLSVCYLSNSPGWV